ncbi:hypothetical protein E1B28_006143 [Marasmius oreades]|uniref:F-box domain-containing protein n=1 Tax=Marasmius oreades TaxID=181124 RepID=A0A9P7UUZ3_9AGAR|nr:uncharacterized protein E1B28_006143 [Marasmius oreades]KAG7095387.1 hypothetical protein E1B28_006143 [Marasmius oreades]
MSLNLPLDILPVIIEHVTPRDLKNVCLVNSVFHGIAVQLLYDRISIYSWHKNGKAKAIMLFTSLSMCPHVAKHVHRLEIRAFPRVISMDTEAEQARVVAKGIRNCINLSAFVWTRDGTLRNEILLALRHCSCLRALEINGHNQEYYDPNILLQFDCIRKISLIMPSAAVVQSLDPWLMRTGKTLRSLTLICKATSIITDHTLEALAPNLCHLEDLHITGCPKVTNRGIFSVISQNVKGILSLGIEGLSSKFDMAVFRRDCYQSRALSHLRSITLTIHQQILVEDWMKQVADLLSPEIPLEAFNIYSTGAFFESPITSQFWENIVAAHQDRLVRVSVHRMLISLRSIGEICRRCRKLEQLFIVIEPGLLSQLGDHLSQAHVLRTMHINYPLIDASQSQAEPPVMSPTEALKLVEQCSSTISQFGCNTRVWKVEREIVIDEKGIPIGVRRQLARYDSPDIPEAFLVVRT